MKKQSLFCLLLWITLLCFPLLGAVPLSDNIYVNDYASCIKKNEKNFINETSKILEDSTGVQVIVLTVKNLDGKLAEEFAWDTLDAWQSGKESISGDVVLLLVSTEDKLFYSLPAGKAANAVQDILISLEGTDYSTSLYEAYKSAVRALFAFSGADPDKELSDALKPGARPDSGGITSGTIMLAAVIIFLTVSSLRTTRKNQQRYGNSMLYQYDRPEKKFRDFDEDDSTGLKGYDD